MPNPFDLLEQFRAFQLASAEILASTDQTWLMRAGVARIQEFVLRAALEAGPPADFAASIGVDSEHGAILYDRVLRAALQRARERALSTNGVQVNGRR